MAELQNLNDTSPHELLCASEALVPWICYLASSSQPRVACLDSVWGRVQSLINLSQGL